MSVSIVEEVASIRQDEGKLLYGSARKGGQKKHHHHKEQEEERSSVEKRREKCFFCIADDQPLHCTADGTVLSKATMINIH